MSRWVVMGKDRHGEQVFKCSKCGRSSYEMSRCCPHGCEDLKYNRNQVLRVTDAVFDKSSHQEDVSWVGSLVRLDGPDHLYDWVVQNIETGEFALVYESELEDIETD